MLGLSGICACREQQRAVDRSGAPAATSLLAKSVITVSGPTVIAAFPVTQAEVDSSDETAEALNDFQFHLRNATGGLRALGVTVHEQYSSPVRWKVNGGSYERSIPSDSVAAYLFLSPTRRDSVVYGVQTDIDLVDLVRQYFHIAPLAGHAR